MYAMQRSLRHPPGIVRNAALALLAGAGALAGPSLAAATVIFVDDDAPPGGDGSGWSTAFSFLQDALAHAAVPANGVTEIRIAQGTYLPDHDETHPAGSGQRGASFDLVSQVALRGGYAGLGGANPDERAIEVYVTTLSGDLAGNDRAGPAN